MTEPLETSRISERAFEEGFVASLAGSPFYRERPKEAFDASLLLDISETVTFIQTTQPKEWTKLSRQFPGEEKATLATQLSNLIQKRGTLEVLRNGVSFNGINLQLAYFKPSSTGNPEHQVNYKANRFAVMRQVYFSTKTPDQSVDVVLFLNGLPIVSVELKNHFTSQNIQHAIAQYRRRDHRELFWKRCLVHFAVDDDTVFMTTKIDGSDTVFLPFNRNTHNPAIYNRFASSYLWDEFRDEDGESQVGILQADSMLTLIQNYLHFEKDEKTGREKFIFPRFHQYLAVRKLLAHAKGGSGHKYLIQHSAGSGKSNSIAWLAHQLANLCGADEQLVFDSIVVITDRKVLDRQLQDTIKQFEKIKGVVTKIDRDTKQLAKALERGDKIIITTLQKFGFIRKIAEIPGKRFAIIVDEAHSSQSGENVKDLKLVLTNDEQLKEAMQKDNEGKEDDESIESVLEKQQKVRQHLPHLSFFAFTATPKQKTLELFGIRDKRVKAGFKPFHVYSMRQAIDEGFILDILQDYTTYATYFALIENERAEGDKFVEELKARRLLLGYVDRHEFAIERKAHIIVDHFIRKCAHKINGRAKAMVVTHSRAHAVRYKQCLDAIIRDKTLNYGVLVAFSGTVTDNEHKLTEDTMNPPGTGNIADAFKMPEQRILVVANKFQTGFDQPLLHTMYVDKQLGGVAAVQTLSRVNRVAPNKIDTMILDFVNTQEDIQKSFQDYYQSTELVGATDPNKLSNLKYSLEKMHVFAKEDVEEFINLFIVKKVTSDKLESFCKRIVDTGYEALRTPDGKEDKAAKDKFRDDLARYVRQYSFVSQIMTFVDAALEKFYLFGKLLLKQIPIPTRALPREIVEMIDMDKFRIQEKQNGSILLKSDDGTLKLTPDDGHRGDGEDDKKKLRIIITKLNKDYGIDFEEADRVVNAIKVKLETDDGLRAAFNTDSLQHLRYTKLQSSIKQAFLENADEFLNFMSKTENDTGFGSFFFSEMFKWYDKKAAITRLGKI